MTAPRDVSRIVPSATALKALAHPLRVRMLGLLRINGPATASGLAQRLGLNSGATSYHLRQLEKHGFIEEDADRGSRRDRWWRARHESTSFLEPGASPEEVESGEAFAQAALFEQVRLMQLALQHYSRLPDAWQRASTLSDFTMALTPEQARALNEKIEVLLWEAMRSTPPLTDGPPPPGTMPFTVMVHAFPYPDGEDAA
jgi:DNA-binding transcriptional ArsR family regulator